MDIHLRKGFRRFYKRTGLYPRELITEIEKRYEASSSGVDENNFAVTGFQLSVKRP